METHNAAEILPKVALQKRQGKESENTYTRLIIDTFGRYLWKVIASQRGVQKYMQLSNH